MPMPKSPPCRSTLSPSIITCWLIVFAVWSATTALPKDTVAGPPTSRPAELPLGQPAWFKLDTQSAILKGEEEMALFDVSRRPQWFQCYDRPVTKQEYQAYMMKIGDRTAASGQTDRAYS